MGQVAATPIQSRYGAHVLKLDARATGEILPFEYVREKISDYLAEQQWRRDVAAYIERLVNQAHIEGVDMSPANSRKVRGSMTTLGEILGQLREPSEVYQIACGIRQRHAGCKAGPEGQMTADGDPCAAALKAVHDFTGKADAEAWVKLIGCVQGSQSPAGACLSEMITWSLSH